MRIPVRSTASWNKTRQVPRIQTTQQLTAGSPIQVHDNSSSSGASVLKGGVLSVPSRLHHPPVLLNVYRFPCCLSLLCLDSVPCRPVSRTPVLACAASKDKVRIEQSLMNTTCSSSKYTCRREHLMRNTVEDT